MSLLAAGRGERIADESRPRQACGGGLRFLATTGALALAFLALLPEEAWAWGPSTHVLLGRHVLASLAALPVPLRELLAAHPYEFLYGNLSADITLAKRYVHYSRHCHRWETGAFLLSRAEAEPLRAFALGYLCHLAADTIAHNYFIPRQLLVTSSTPQVGHAYWEHRFDSHLDPEHVRRARAIVQHDHAGPDQLLEEVLTQAVFSFRTNKRIFQQLIHLSNDERWQELFVRVVAQSRWDLPDAEVERYLAVTRGIVLEFLREGVRSRACGLDPIGRENLRLAKRVRRRTIRDSRRESGRLLDLRLPRSEIAAMADLFFALPSVPSPIGVATAEAPDSFEADRLGFWERFTAGIPAPA